MATSVGQVLVFGTGTFLAYKNSGKEGSSLLFYSGAGFMLVSGRRIIRPRGFNHPKWGPGGAPWKDGMEGIMDQWNDFSKRGFFSEIEAVARQSSSLPKLKFDVINTRAIREGRGARNALKRAIEEKEQIQKERAAGKLEPPTLEEVAKKRGARKAMEKAMKKQWKEAMKESMAVDDSVKNLYKQAKRAVGKDGDEGAGQADKDKDKAAETQEDGQESEEAKRVEEEEEQEKVDKLRSKMEEKMKAKRRKERPFAREIDTWDLAEEEKVTYVFDFPPKHVPNPGKGPNPIERFQYVAESIGSMARPQDEVVLRVISPGGEAALYGYLGCILKEQFPKGGPKLTVTIDRVGASGGYLMAAPGHSIIAAPTAYVGSIGVYMAMPNLHKKLAKNEIEWLEFTAGEHKCPVSTFGEIKDSGKQHTELRLKSVHEVFKQFVKGCRPDIDIEKVATGDVWQGEEAKALGLVDDVMTSNQLIRNHMQDGRWVVEVSYSPQEALVHQLFSAVGQGVATGVEAGLPASLSTAILPHLHRLTGGSMDSSSLSDSNPQGVQFKMSESEILNKMQS